MRRHPLYRRWFNVLQILGGGKPTRNAREIEGIRSVPSPKELQLGDPCLMIRPENKGSKNKE